MQSKLLLLLVIIILITLLLFIKSSRRRLWLENNTRNSRMFTIRGIALILVVILFLVFSLLR